MNSFEHYAHVFANLHSNKNPRVFPASTLTRAPHKPLLLLSVLDLYTEGLVHNGFVPLAHELGETFSRYWHEILPTHPRPNLALPFFHLKNDGEFWQLVASPGNADVVTHLAGIQGLAHLQRLVLGAQIPADLSLYLADPVHRDDLRSILVHGYFAPGIQTILFRQGSVNVEAYQYSEILLNRKMVAEAREAETYRPAVRSQGFRRAIVIAYDHRCATCGIRVVLADGSTAVEAAHIKPWRESYNDDPTNGLALCKLCHWCFDEGVLGIDQQRAILISRQLEAAPNVPAHLATLKRRPIIGPDKAELAPDLAFLAWHQHRIFQPI